MILNKMRQLYLDLRQKDFAGVLCEECGMRYDRSFPAEVKLHEKYHNARDKRYWRGKIKHYVLSLRLADERIVVEKVKRGTDTLKKTLIDLLTCIQEQCGVIDEFGDSEVFLLLSKERQVIGALVMLKKETKALVKPQGEEVRCKVVVQMVWIHEQYRGKKLAQAMLKSAMLSESLLPQDICFTSTTPAITKLAQRLFNHAEQYQIVAEHD